MQLECSSLSTAALLGAVKIPKAILSDPSATDLNQTGEGLPLLGCSSSFMSMTSEEASICTELLAPRCLKLETPEQFP